MELGSKQSYLPCFAAPPTPGSPRTTPTFQSIIIYISSPTIFPVNFICLILCSPILAFNGSTTTTIITPAKFYGGPPIISLPTYAIYGINLLLITVLLFTPTPTVVLISAPEFTAPPR